MSSLLDNISPENDPASNQAVSAPSLSPKKVKVESKEKVECEVCHSMIVPKNMSSHKKTKKHLEALENQEPSKGRNKFSKVINSEEDDYTDEDGVDGDDGDEEDDPAETLNEIHTMVAEGFSLLFKHFNIKPQ